MMRLGRLLMASSILAAAVLTRAPAHAENDDEVMLRRGVELRKEGRDGEALAAFRSAYEQRPTPRARAQIALAEQALGHWVEAESGVVQALASEGDPWIRRNLEPLRAALETIRDHIGTIAVECNIDGASVFLDSRLVGKSPLDGPLRAAAGISTIGVKATGYGTVERRLEVLARSEVKIEIVVVPSEPTRGSSLAPPASGDGAAGLSPMLSAPAGSAGSNGSTPEGPRDGAAYANSPHDFASHSLRTIGFISLAGSGALLAAGTVAEIVREHNASTYNDDSQCFFGDVTRRARCGSYLEAARTAQVLSIAGLTMGGVAAVTGVTLLFVSGKGASQRTVRLDPVVGPRWSAIECEVLF